jgi:curved DNA-binding protein CbpA
MNDPFSILGVDENAGDDEIKRRYLALVRAFPPDREPQRFQEYRRAFEALQDRRRRLQVRLLETHDSALFRLKLFLLEQGGTGASRASRASVTALLNEGIEQAGRS